MTAPIGVISDDQALWVEYIDRPGFDMGCYKQVYAPDGGYGGRKEDEGVAKPRFERNRERERYIHTECDVVTSYEVW